MAAGTYSVTVTSSTGCVYTGSVLISQPSAIVVTYTQVNNTVGGGHAGAISLAISGGTPGYTVTWSNGATGANITCLAAGNYCATITDAHGCSASVCVTITQPVCHTPLANTNNDASADGNHTPSVDEYPADLSAYPNPFAEKSTIEFTLTYDSKVTVEVYSITGDLVSSIFSNEANANQKYSADFNAEDLKAGIYFVKMVTDRKVYNHKVILVD